VHGHGGSVFWSLVKKGMLVAKIPGSGVKLVRNVGRFNYRHVLAGQTPWISVPVRDER
jgi:hypothetical protein